MTTSNKNIPAGRSPYCPSEEPELCDPELRLSPSLLPDLITLTPYDLRLVVNQANGSIHLRFSNCIMDLGRGPAEVWGAREDPEDHTVEITQRVYCSDGSDYVFTIGHFVFHPMHGHWHWDNFSQHEVWRIDSTGVLLERAATSGKVGYCLRDNTLVPAEIIEQTGVSTRGFKSTMVYGDCGWRRQGISPGWVDTYRYHLAEQYVDITDLSDGDYALVSVVDSDKRLMERKLPSSPWKKMARRRLVRNRQLLWRLSSLESRSVGRVTLALYPFGVNNLSYPCSFSDDDLFYY